PCCLATRPRAPSSPKTPLKCTSLTAPPVTSSPWTSSIGASANPLTSAPHPTPCALIHPIPGPLCSSSPTNPRATSPSCAPATTRSSPSSLSALLPSASPSNSSSPQKRSSTWGLGASIFDLLS